MKVKVSFSAVGLSLKVNEGREGKKYYQISIDQEGEAGNLPISEEAYNSISGSFVKYKPVNVLCEYNDQYKNLRVVGITQGRI